MCLNLRWYIIGVTIKTLNRKNKYKSLTKENATKGSWEKYKQRHCGPICFILIDTEKYNIPLSYCLVQVEIVSGFHILISWIN